MDRFVSHYALRLDAKGRVSIPASFRAVLARDGFEGLYCYPTLDRPALDAGGNALLREIETLIARFSPYSEEREQLSAALYGTSEVLKIDGEGRAILTEPLKTSRRHQGRDRLCRPGPQISDSGSRDAFARNSRRPPRRSARSRSSSAPGERRKVRMEHGNDDEQRQRTRCRWRTGSSYSRAHPPCGRIARCALRRRLCGRHVRRRRLQP